MAGDARERRRVPRWLVVAGVVLAVLGFAAWWTYPGTRLDRELGRISLPDALDLTHEESNPQLWVFDCFDVCSTATRYYVSALPEREAADALVAALRSRGYQVDGAKRCAPRSGGGRGPHAVRQCAYSVSGLSGGFSAYAVVGPRGDGRPGVSLQISVSG